MMSTVIRGLAAGLCLLLAAFEARAQSPLFELVTDEILQPIHIASAGDSRLFVSSRQGRVYVVQGGAVLPTPFLDIVDDVGEAGEGGLLSIAFHPNYAANRLVFVSYTDNEQDSVVARYAVSGTDPNLADPDSGQIVIEVDQGAATNHRGGTILFGPDGFLYFALGDGGPGDDPQCRAQRTDMLQGKMLRLAVNDDPNDVTPPFYTIPASNPFSPANDPNDLVADEIWASGLRNPFRFSFDRETGDLWIGDVGEQAREEVDFQPASSTGGENYGWKMLEGTVCRVTGDPTAANCPASTPPCDDPGYTAPVFEYASNPDQFAITGGFVYRGSSAPAFQGRYIFADSQTGEYFALGDGGGGMTAEPLDDTEHSPVAFGEDQNGELYVADIGGRVLRLRLDQVSGGGGDVASCVNAANARVAKYAAAAEKDLGKCVALAAAAKLGSQTLAQCSVADRKGALAKQQTALEKVEAKRCAPLPPFGFAGSEIAGEASDAAGRELAQQAFGPDLDAAIVEKAEDPDTAACQKAVWKGLSSCQKARRKELLHCKKAGLKDGSITSVESLAECLASDARGKVAAACDADTGKLATKLLPNKCEARGVDLAVAFPGCDESDTAALAACLDASGRCAHCLVFDAADGLDTLCDAFDDGADNASCDVAE